jgi:hypothetical protein
VASLEPLTAQDLHAAVRLLLAIRAGAGDGVDVCKFTRAVCQLGPALAHVLARMQAEQRATLTAAEWIELDRVIARAVRRRVNRG